MAKKRVHELAKQYDLPSAEVVKRLTAAGIQVKAAASAVDEDAAAAAITGKKPKPAANGGQPQAAPAARQPSGGPLRFGPLGRGEGPPPPRRTPVNRPGGDGRAGAGGAQGRGPAGAQGRGPGGRPDGRAPAGPGARGPAGAQGRGGDARQGGQGAGGGTGGAGGPGSRRPSRASLQGERQPGAAGGVRRVVIDSQASRRPGGPGGGPGGPGGPGGGPPGGPRRRRGGGGSRGARRRAFLEAQEAAREQGPAPAAKLAAVKIPSGSTVKEVAEYLTVPVPEVIKKLMTLGEMATLTQTLSDDAVQVLADEFEKEILITRASEEAEPDEVFEDAPEDLVDRPPVVTIMGHVDHGKTSLLDAIRETEVAAGEAGGITQHIGAYQVHHGDKLITFLDTPGHEAFTAMRARGAQVTDIAVIVVAADDGVKPQTREAVDHARAAGVPLLVAVNKIDKEGAQPDRVRTEMTQLGVQPEEWGGDTMFVDVSAKAKTNLEDLLDSILLLAEVEELKANPEAEASGVVIESKLDPGRGAVVTVLVQRGTLHVGDAIVAGAHWGRVRAMHDYLGRRVKEAGPAEPVEVLGFDTVPEAGEAVKAVENDRKARALANERSHRLKAEQLARRNRVGRVTLDSIFEQQADQTIKELNLVLKADVSGSLEAFEDEIARLPQEEVQVYIVRSGVGGITESDVMLAAASDAIVMGFNVRPVGDAAQVADREGVEIRSYSVIYKAIDELRDAMQGMLAPEEVEETVGRVEIRAIFRASRIGVIAGSYVTDGRVTRGARARLVRDGTVVWTGDIASLRRFNEDVREVAAGYECGIVLNGYQDIKEGDELEVFETRQVERTLA